MILRAPRAARTWLLLSGATLVAASCGRWDAPPAVASAGGAAGEGGSAGTTQAGGSGAVAGTSDGAHGGATELVGGNAGTGGDVAEGGREPGAAGAEALGGTSALPVPEAGAAGVVEMPEPEPEDGGLVTPGPCGFFVRYSLSSEIGTVAIVKWDIELAHLESAEIQFGLDTSYGLVAPVDLAAKNYRTLLLGMKPSRDYHARVVVHGDDKVCTSDDFVVTTGPVKNGLPPVTVTTLDKSRAAGGYLVSSMLSKGPAFIIDADGEYVWWSAAVGLGRSQMSWDGKTMWYGNINVQGGGGFIASVPMDGVGIVTHREFGDPHHDFTVLPDGTVGYIEHDGSGCDRIMERWPDESIHEIVNVHDAHGGTDGGTNKCHTNSIHYHPGDDSYTFSDLNQNAYTKVKRTGEVDWVLGGDTSYFTGDGAIWERQHGHDLIAPDRLLFFNNGKTGTPATAVEVKLDFDTMTASRVWEYPGSGNESVIYGDVQRLDNGNTLVTYSIAGIVEEVAPDGTLVESTTFGLGGAIGYTVKRASLYGPPPVQ